MGGPSDTGSTMATQQHDTSLSSSTVDGDGAPSAVHKRVTRSSAAAAAAATAAEVRPACRAWYLPELRSIKNLRIEPDSYQYNTWFVAEYMCVSDLCTC